MIGILWFASVIIPFGVVKNQNIKLVEINQNLSEYSRSLAPVIAELGKEVSKKNHEAFMAMVQNIDMSVKNEIALDNISTDLKLFDKWLVIAKIDSVRYGQVNDYHHLFHWEKLRYELTYKR